MKKKILNILLISTLILGLTACGNENVSTEDINKDSSTEKVDTNTKFDSQETETEQTEVENWGVDESTVAERDDVKSRAYIKFPTLSGIDRGTGKIAYQTDKSLVILGSEIDFNEPEVENDKSESIFPAYFLKVVEIMKAYREYDFNDFAFEITKQETLTVNDYEMCKYFGKHTFTFDGEPCEIAFVAYTTRLKGNNAAVYWMVLDETEDQSLSSVIESHADKMAQTLHE